MRILTAFIALMGLAACSGAPPPAPPVPVIPPEVETFLGNNIVQLMLAPDRVESYRVAAEINDDIPVTLGGHPITATGPLLSPAQIEKLRSLVLSGNSYIFGSSKRCPFLPSYGFKIIRGQEDASILVAPGCSLWRFEGKAKKAIEDFDPVAKDVGMLLDQLFPIQK